MSDIFQSKNLKSKAYISDSPVLQASKSKEKKERDDKFHEFAFGVM